MIRRPELSLQRTKRSIVIAGYKTSLSLEAGFRLALKEIAAQAGNSISQLVNRIDTDRDHAPLSPVGRDRPGGAEGKIEMQATWLDGHGDLSDRLHSGAIS